MSPAVALLAGAWLDVLVGDPRAIPHPVRAIGWCAGVAERFWRSTGVPLKAAGALFTVTVVVAACGVVRLTLPLASVYWIWALLAMRSLDGEADCTIQLLDDLPAARAQLATIVGRDTTDLSEAEIVRAVLETVSENFSDAVAAPLFWFAVGGPVAMAAYKSINTLDSIVGHRNATYREFGWFAARLDDLANWMPARLSVLLISLAARSSMPLRIALRDGASQPSPNSGYPEAAFAGALSVQLGGPSTYAGVLSDKPTLGDAHGPLSREVWTDARKLFLLSCALAVLATLGAVCRRR